LTNKKIYGKIITERKREVIKMTDTKWIWAQTEQAFGNGYDEYISADGRYCKQVWFDGYEEIFEIA
jgi:hypothetical protein